MKVLLLNQAFYPDGAATAQILLDLAKHLIATGCDVTAVSGRRGYDSRQTTYPTREKFEGIEIHRVGSTGLGKRRVIYRLMDFLTFDLALIWKLIGLPKQDVVISFTSPPLIGVFGTLFCWFKGGSSVQWLMDVNPDIAIAAGYLRKGSLLSRFLTWIFRLSLRQSDQVVVLDRWMKEKIVAHGVSDDRITIVPPWPVQEASDSIPTKVGSQSFRQQYGLEGKFVVLYSGNHSVVHPLDTVLGAAVHYKENPDIRFVFIGGGVRVSDVGRAVKKFGLTNVVQIPSQPRELLNESLNCADLHVAIMGDAVSGLVHSSKIYGILATGKPYVFIGPAKSHVADLLADCPYGFHVENGALDELIKIIDKVRGLPVEALNEFHERNTQYVKVNYTAQRILNGFTEQCLLALREPTVVSHE